MERPRDLRKDSEFKGIHGVFSIKILYSDSREGFEREGPVLVMIRRLWWSSTGSGALGSNFLEN